MLPIPPGTHWGDAMPIVLPDAESDSKHLRAKALPPPVPKTSHVKEQTRRITPALGGVWFLPAEPANPEALQPKPAVKVRAPRKAAAKNNPKLVTAAPELGNRYLEEINSAGTPTMFEGKYQVAIILPAQAKSTAHLKVATPMPLPALLAG